MAAKMLEFSEKKSDSEDKEEGDDKKEDIKAEEQAVEVETGTKIKVSNI